MLIFNEKTCAIAMTRGDSESLTVRKQGGAWTEEETITFTVREDAEGEIAFQKTAYLDDEGAAIIAIESGDTEGRDFGNYVYDIQYTGPDGKIRTLIPPRPGRLPKFTLTQEATY